MIIRCEDRVAFDHSVATLAYLRSSRIVHPPPQLEELQRNTFGHELRVQLSRIGERSDSGSKLRHLDEQKLVSLREMAREYLLGTNCVTRVRLDIGHKRRDTDPSFLLPIQISELEMVVDSLQNCFYLHTVFGHVGDAHPRLMGLFTKLCCKNTVDTVELVGGIDNNLCYRFGVALCQVRSKPLFKLKVCMADSGIKNFSQGIIDLKKHDMLRTVLIFSGRGGRASRSSNIMSPAISGLLDSKSCTVRQLFIHGRIDDFLDFIQCIVSALKTNKSLESLIANEPIPLEGWNLILTCICDTTTIQSTYDSNHSLWQIGTPILSLTIDWSVDYQQTAKYLEMNRNGCKKTVRRKKILDCHFSGDFDIAQFNDMNAELRVRIGHYIDGTTAFDRVNQDSIEKKALLFFYKLIKYEVGSNGDLFNNKLKKRTCKA